MPVPTQDPNETINNLKGVIGNLLDQIYQMKGMFDDEDKTIQTAIDEAEEVLGLKSTKQQAIEVNCTITYWKGEDGNRVTVDNAEEALSETLICDSYTCVPANLNIHSIKEVTLEPINEDGSYFE